MFLSAIFVPVTNSRSWVLNSNVLFAECPRLHGGRESWFYCYQRLSTKERCRYCLIVITSDNATTLRCCTWFKQFSNTQTHFGHRIVWLSTDFDKFYPPQPWWHSLHLHLASLAAPETSWWMMQRVRYHGYSRRSFPPMKCRSDRATLQTGCSVGFALWE